MSRFDHYQTLGVPKTASHAEVRRGYRRKASKMHPDKGGTDAQMAELNKAWDCLGDPQRRIAYDETGTDIGDGPTAENRSQSILMSAFNELLDKGVDKNITVQVRQLIQTGLQGHQSQLSGMRAAQKKLNQMRDKVRKKGDGSNVYQLLIDQRLETIERGVADISRQIEDMQEAIRMLDDYSEELVIETVRRYTIGGTGTGTGFF